MVRLESSSQERILFFIVLYYDILQFPLAYKSFAIGISFPAIMGNRNSNRLRFPFPRLVVMIALEVNLLAICTEFLVLIKY